MKQHLSNFKHIFMTLAFMLTFSASAYAFNVNFTQNNQNYNTPITLTSSDYTINITGIEAGWTCTFSSSISIPSSSFYFTINKNGNGKLILNFTCTYDLRASLVVNQGTVQINKQLSGLSITGTAIEVKSGATFRVEAPHATIIPNGIYGAGNVRFYCTTGTGDQIITYTGANAITGTTTVEKGILCIGANTQQGSVGGNIVLDNANTSVAFHHNTAHTYNGVISGAGTVLKYTDNNTLTFTKVQTYTGPTYIGGGTLALTLADALYSSSHIYLTQATSKFSFSNFQRIKNLTSTQANAEIILSGTGATLIVGSPNGTDGGGTYAGKFTGAGRVWKDGSAILTLSGSSTYSGETGIYWGTVVFSSGSLGTGDIYFRGTANSTLRWAAGNTKDISGRIKSDVPACPITFDVGTNTVFFNSSLPSTITGKITKAGTGKLDICAAQNFSSEIVVAAGTFIVSNDGTSLFTGSIANTSGVTVNAGATFEYWVSGASTSVTFSKGISGKGNFTKSKDGTLTLSSNNTYEGKTTISGGTLATSSYNVTNKYSSLSKNTSELSISSGATLEHTSQEFVPLTISAPITGAGNLVKKGPSILTLAGANTYTGKTTVSAGTLRFGNGTSSSVTGTSEVTIAAGATLRVEGPHGTTLEFPINGAGNLEFSNTTAADGIFLYKGENTITGTTTVEKGILQIGTNSTTGSVSGNINLANANSGVAFHHTNNHTYSGIISGAGQVLKYTDGMTLTFNKAHTYTGPTYIGGGTLVLTSTGSIQNSSSVTLTQAASRLDLSSGDKTIKGLHSSQTNAEVILGAKTLTIDASAYCSYSGKISGNGGGIIKKGNTIFDLLGTTNSASGLFSLQQGRVFIASWGGNFTQAAGTMMDIFGVASVGGNLTLNGGEIIMDLNAATPSKLNVMGQVFASGNTKLTIATGTVTSRPIMQAAGGLTTSSLAFFTLNLSGATGTLAANGTELLLTATNTDNTPPTPGAGVNGTADINSASLSWNAATDNVTPPENLRYFVYQSSSNNLNTPANCETNGTLLNAGGTMNLTSYNVAGLSPNTTYYFNVVVSDQAGNKAAYTTKQLVTSNEPKIVSVTISPNSATLSPGESKQFTATVVAVGGASENVEWIITGNASGTTQISSGGLLVVGSDEPPGTIKVKAVSIFNSSVFDEVTVTVKDVGIASTTLSNQITVYPNPTTGQLTIDNRELSIKNVEIYDIVGRKQLSIDCQLSIEIIDVSNLSNGTYFLRIQTENGVVTKKVIKQ